jgi:O-antigen ligase
MVTFASNFILFYIVYNFIYNTKDYFFFFKILVILNILVAIYCAFQFIGLNDYLNIENSDIGMAANRADRRLVGPFGATALTAEYLIFQTLILCYLLFFYEKTKQSLYLVLICTNLIFLLATGNRGGLLTLCLAFMGFSYFYRKELGVKRVFLFTIAGSFALVIASAVTLYLSDLNVIYERLLGTDTEGVVLDTRQRVWPAAWEKIVESPYVGHGPRLHRPDGREYQAIAYPHSLYLFILYTVGIIGFAGHMVFFGCIITKIAKGTSRVNDDFLNGLPKLGLLIIGLFLISQVRIELLRFMTGDYQHYFFALLGFFVAVSDLRREQSKSY